MRTSSAARGMAAVVALLALLVAVPALLLAASTARFGHAAPLHGLDAPWRWTLDSARSWWHRLTDRLDTSAELIDLFLHLAVVLAWACVVVIVVTVIGEVVYQLRHGMPSSGHRNVLGLGWLGRVVAGGLVALVPLTASMPALATGGSASARSAAPATVDGVDVTAGEASTTPASSAPPPTVAMPGTAVDHVRRPARRLGLVDRRDDRRPERRRRRGRRADRRRQPRGDHGRRPAVHHPGADRARLAPGRSRVARRRRPVARRPVARRSGGTRAARRRRRRLVLAHRHRGPRRHLGDGAVGRGGARPHRGADRPQRPTPRSRRPCPHRPRRDGRTARRCGGSGQRRGRGANGCAGGRRRRARGGWRRRVGSRRRPAGSCRGGRARRRGGCRCRRERRRRRERSAGAADGCRAEGRARHRPARLRAAGVGRRGGRRDPAAFAHEQRRRPGGHCRCNDRGRLGRAGGARAVGRRSCSPRARSVCSKPVVASACAPRPSTTGCRRHRVTARRDRAEPPRARRTGARSPAWTWRCASPRPTSPRSGPACSPSKRCSSGELRLTTDTPVTPPSGPWELDLDGRTWVLPARWQLEDLARRGRRAVAPCPALAHVGSTAGGQLYVDLEAAGLLAVDLPAAARR